MLQPPNIANSSTYGPPADPIAPLRAALRGHYEIERELGQGAFATVYLARDLKHERKVAIKVLNADPTSEMGELRFIREIRLLARLQHPNILPLHDSGHVDALLYYVMPYVSGETLRQRIDRERQLPVIDAACLAKETADALSCAHSQGIVHRDIKPENILVSAGHAVVADFGIARAIDIAGIRSLTRTGIGSPGTPAYMSPEQLLGDREIDARSDIYSVGCVIHEMLTGRPPFAGKEGFVKRFTEGPPQMSATRRDVPRWLDAVVQKAMARNPGERYSTAADLVRAIADGLSMDPAKQVGGAASEVARTFLDTAPAAAYAARTATSANEAATPIRKNKWSGVVRAKYIAPVAAATLLLILFFSSSAREWRRSLFAPTAADSTRLVVLPFDANGPSTSSDSVGRKLFAALGQWDGLNLVPYDDVRAAAREVGGVPRSRDDAIAIAKKLGASKLLWRTSGGPDVTGTQLQLLDSERGTLLRNVSIPSQLDQTGYDAAIRNLLDPTNRPASARGGDGRTRSYPAWTAYGRAHTSLHEWNLVDAEAAFRTALSADPEYAPARVWLAQTLAWRRSTSPRQWRADAVRGALDSTKLAPRERLIATGLIDLADRRYPEACGSYSAMIKRDSGDFVGWYGLARCHALDSMVVASPPSPSGWAFRSRYSDAADAYIRALQIDPGAHAIVPFADLTSLLPTSPTQTRQGQNDKGLRFAAFPAMVNNAPIFVPYELARFASLPADRFAAARNRALQHNQDVLRDFTTDWTQRSPASASAFEALADVLEVRGEISQSDGESASALDAANRARKLAINSQERLSAMTRVAWLKFKQGSFAQASALADTILATNPQPGLEEAAKLAGLAALTGKVVRTAELAATTTAFTGPGLEVPAQVRDPAAKFFARAALGICSAPTFSLERTLDEEIAANVAQNDEQSLREALKARSLAMLAPCTGAQSSLRVRAPKGRLLRMQQAFARSDLHTLRAYLDTVAEDARTQRPGDVSLDFTYQVAWLRLASGDTTGAERQLDLALRALPSLSPTAIREVASAAAAGRAMVLRADIAAMRNDNDDRQRWAHALLDLWRYADRDLQPVVARMRAMSDQHYVK